MKLPIAPLVSACLIAFSGTSRATEYDNDDDDRSGHVPVVALEISLIPSGQTSDQSTIQTDLYYAASMKRHHAGAVTMSTDYLEDPRGTNPILRKMARAIIANQRFEIAVLDEIRRRAAPGPSYGAGLCGAALHGVH